MQWDSPSSHHPNRVWGQPFQLETMFGLFYFLHHIQGLVNSVMGRYRYMYLDYHSSNMISLSIPSSQTRGWFARVSDLLGSMGIHINHLPLFWYSLDALGHLLPIRKVLNKIIRDDIYRQFIQITCFIHPGGLPPKMAFYAKHFLELEDGFIVRPQYTLWHWEHALRIPVGQFRVGSHRLRVESNHQIDRPDKICRLCPL
jgi:hypothetical protein